MSDDTDARALEIADGIVYRLNSPKMALAPDKGASWLAAEWIGPLRERLAEAVAARAQAERERDEARLLVTEANNSLYGSQGYFHSLDGGQFNRYHLSSGIETLKAAANRAWHRAEAAEARAAALRKALERIYAGSDSDARERAAAALAADQAGGEEDALSQASLPGMFTELSAETKDALAAIDANIRDAHRAAPHILVGASPPQPATAGAPEGWRLVPVEPTKAMRHAGGLTLLDDDDVLAVTSHEAEQTYTAMIEAAPAAPSPAPDGRVRELETWLRLARKFMDDALRLDFNEDRTLSWIAFAGARIDALLAKEPSHGR